jgi:CHAT domain-containing protein/cytochrome c-type biogenesis protein CcmH/NrfG
MAVENPFAAPGAADEFARQHAETCKVCAAALRISRVARPGLQTDPTSMAAKRTSACPEEGIWLRIAAGLESPNESGIWVDHAVECDYCGRLFREATEDLTTELSREEQELVERLSSASAAWRRRTARAMSRISDEGNGREATRRRTAPEILPSRLFRSWVPWAASTVALLVIVASGGIWYGLRRTSLSSVNRLIAAAYTQQRTLELRIPNARYAEVRMQRGAERSVTDHPASLLEAETDIARKLERHPSDPGWLQAKARADLLDGNYDSAVVSLERALEVEPDSPEIMIDLASAYYQRGGPSSSSVENGRALEFLGRALAKTPDSPIGLFNRAVIAERMFLYTQSAADWERYLQIEPHGEWSDEARRHLETVRGKLKNQKGSVVPLLSPRQLLEAGNGFRAQLLVERRFEDYLHVAVRDWLPEAYTSETTAQRGGSEARAALAVIANVANAEHRDRWLSDLLAGSAARTFPEALAALASAVKFGDRGDYTASLEQAGLADRLFKDSGNAAGSLRSRMEALFALHLSQQGALCLRAASQLERALDGYAYQWLQIQFHLEQAVCLSMMGNLGESKRITAWALEKSRRFGYRTLSLRALGIASDTDLAIGDIALGWESACEGLAQYWSGIYEPMQGYNLYTDLDTAADLMRRPHLQVAIWRQALTLIDSNEDLLLRAMAHSWMANSAYSADLPKLAEEEYREADRLFAAAPQTHASLNDRMEAEIWLARLMARRGDFDLAITLLSKIQLQVPVLSNDYVAINYYSALGEVRLRRGSIDDAGEPLLAAAGLAERSLESLHSERERAAWSRETAGTYRGLVEWELRRGQPQAALEIWEWYRGASLRAGRSRVRSERDRSPSNHLDASDGESSAALDRLQVVAARLRSLSSQTVLSYAILPDGLAIWVYDDHGVFVQWFPQDTANIANLAHRFTALCASPKSDLGALQREGRRLYDILFSPVEKRLSPERTLVIETDTTLAAVPFEVLVDPRGHYLAERGPITFSIGLYYGLGPGIEEGISSRSSALVVAVPSAATDEGLLPLPDVFTEAEMVAHHFEDARLLEGEQAGLDNVQSNLSESVVFHFAGHAVISSGAPALLLADSDRTSGRSKMLNAETLGAMSVAKTRLVVLSACTTELSGDAVYDDSESLADAFLRVGVPHVLASRWPVDSHVTAKFMQDFYGALLSGKTVSDSVQQAAFALRLEPQTAHPYYWSAFGAFGLK